jgi:hypothetical protein
MCGNDAGYQKQEDVLSEGHAAKPFFGVARAHRDPSATGFRSRSVKPPRHGAKVSRRRAKPAWTTATISARGTDGRANEWVRFTIVGVDVRLKLGRFGLSNRWETNIPGANVRLLDVDRGSDRRAPRDHNVTRDVAPSGCFTRYGR